MRNHNYFNYFNPFGNMSKRKEAGTASSRQSTDCKISKAKETTESNFELAAPKPYGLHAGIKFKMPSRKETTIKPFSFETRSKTAKEAGPTTSKKPTDCKVSKTKGITESNFELASPKPYGLHAGIKFKPSWKETTVKPFCFETRTKTAKEKESLSKTKTIRESNADANIQRKSEHLNVLREYGNIDSASTSKEVKSERVDISEKVNKKLSTNVEKRMEAVKLPNIIPDRAAKGREIEGKIESNYIPGKIKERRNAID